MSVRSHRVGCFAVGLALLAVGCADSPAQDHGAAGAAGWPAVGTVATGAGTVAPAVINPATAGKADAPPPSAAGAGGKAGAPASAGSGAAGTMAASAGASGSAGSAAGAANGGAPASPVSACQASAVGPVPAELRQRFNLHEFYKKHLDAAGIPVLASDKPADASLVGACELLTGMLAKRDDVRKSLIAAKVRFVIIGAQEGTAEVPEYGYLDRPQADKDQINQRARGLGGQVASCGEENMLCLDGDRYWDESICLHEFSHTISTYGVYAADRTFERRLEAAYQSAADSGILDNTYRKENEQEYWAEGVQDFYDSNASATPSNGIHNSVDTRDELLSFDPTLYDLVAEVFPATLAWKDCHGE